MQRLAAGAVKIGVGGERKPDELMEEKQTNYNPNWACLKSPNSINKSDSAGKRTSALCDENKNGFCLVCGGGIYIFVKNKVNFKFKSKKMHI